MYSEKMEEKLTNYEWFDRFCNNWEKFYYQSNNTANVCEYYPVNSQIGEGLQTEHAGL